MIEDIREEDFFIRLIFDIYALKEITYSRGLGINQRADIFHLGREFLSRSIHLEKSSLPPVKSPFRVTCGAFSKGRRSRQPHREIVLRKLRSRGRSRWCRRLLDQPTFYRPSWLSEKFSETLGRSLLPRVGSERVPGLRWIGRTRRGGEGAKGVKKEHSASSAPRCLL